MKTFKFQKFSIQQSEKVFRVGTDAVLIGALADVGQFSNGLEIGSGTGIIALMLAQRNLKIKITAVELNPEAVEIARENFRQSEFNSRLTVIHEDIKDYSSNQNFDFIVCNPPYFEENGSEKDKLARQKIELDFIDLIQKSSELITKDGVFSVIIPSGFSNEFILLADDVGFYLNRKINIFGIKGGDLKRNVLEFSKTESQLIELDFVVEETPRKYSDQYLKVTKDFHVFKNKELKK